MLGKAYSKSENPKSRVNFYNSVEYFNVDGKDLSMNQLRGAYDQIVQKLTSLLSRLQFGGRKMEWRKFVEEDPRISTVNFSAIKFRGKENFSRLRNQIQECKEYC